MNKVTNVYRNIQIPNKIYFNINADDQNKNDLFNENRSRVNDVTKVDARLAPKSITIIINAIKGGIC